jgi:transposase
LSRGDLSEVEWRILKVLLPVEREPLQHRLDNGPRACFGSGRKRGIHKRALGRSRGGFTSKIHCLGDARGRPIAFDLTSGEAADCKTYDTLIDLPEQAPDALLADRAYDTDAIRNDLKKRGIESVPGLTRVRDEKKRLGSGANVVARCPTGSLRHPTTDSGTSPCPRRYWSGPRSRHRTWRAA